MKNFNSQKGIAPIILVLILAVVAAGVGGAQYFKKQQAKQVAKSTVTDETASWKTYANTKYGFELKYPKDWEIRNKDWEKEVRSQDKDSVELRPVKEQSEMGSYIMIGGVSLKKDQGFEEILINSTTLGESEQHPKIDAFTTRKIGNNAFYYIHNYLFEGQYGVVYYAVNKDSVISFALSSLTGVGQQWTDENYDVDKEPNHAVLKQILSTFKFTLDSKSLNFDKAIKILQDIPEVQIINKAIVKVGRTTFLDPQNVNGDIVRVFLYEGGFPDKHTTVIDIFNVNIKSKLITVDDVAMTSGKDFISLDEWRKTVKERFQ